MLMFGMMTGYIYSYYYYDWSYMLIVLAGFIICELASIKLNATYKKYEKYKSSAQMTGAQAAQQLLRSQGIYDVQVVHAPGRLTDNYNPLTKKLSLSDSTYSQTSVAAIGVAAHECGHAVQHNEQYIPLKIRALLVPVVNIGARISWILIFLGLFLASSTGQMFINLGIFAFSLAVIFQLVTLPVEYNASSRALKLLKTNHILRDDELKYTKKVLSAAAMTYVAAVAASLMQLVRLVVVFGGRRRD
ncbi:MAG: zinc metallopeptidase [Eubacterium sp.]